MKKIYFRLLLAPAILALFFAGTNWSSSSPGAKTGSPGDNGTTCTQCHAGTASPVNDWISTDIPVLGYVTGDTYMITATGTHAGVGKFGFELTAEDESGNKVGSFNITDNQTQSGNGGASVTHNSSGTAPSGDSKTWTMEWTAPATDVGEITFYAAFNATNGNGNTAGDVVYTSNLSFVESTVGINDEIAVADFTFGPNPSIGSIQVSHPYSSAQIRIFDISGKTVVNLNDYNAGNTIELHDLNSGVYFIQLQAGNAIKSQKLILK